MVADVICSGFPAGYNVLEGEAMVDGPALQEFRSPLDAATEPCIDVTVSAASGLRWLGRFYGRRGDRSLVACTPSLNHFLVVAGGIPYWVPADEPTAFQGIAYQPVRAVHCSPSQGLLVLEGWTSLAAIGSDGQLVWRSSRLVSDGFEEVRLTSARIWVRGYFAPDNGEVERSLDLASGLVT